MRLLQLYAPKFNQQWGWACISQQAHTKIRLYIAHIHRAAQTDIAQHSHNYKQHQQPHPSPSLADESEGVVEGNARAVDPCGSCPRIPRLAVRWQPGRWAPEATGTGCCSHTQTHLRAHTRTHAVNLFGNGAQLFNPASSCFFTFPSLHPTEIQAHKLVFQSASGLHDLPVIWPESLGPSESILTPGDTHGWLPNHQVAG